MFLRKDLAREYPNLNHYITVNIPQLKKVRGVWKGLMDVTAGNSDAQWRVNTALTNTQWPFVVIAPDWHNYYNAADTMTVRETTAARFETKRPHVLRGRWGKVYLAGLELMLCTIDYALIDRDNPVDMVPYYDRFLGQVYGLDYGDVLRAHRLA